MRHVAREEETIRERCHEAFLGITETAPPESHCRRCINAPQHLHQHRRARALLRTAADLLMVEECDDPHALRHALLRRSDEPLYARPDGRHIVETRRRQEFARRTSRYVLAENALRPKRAAPLERVRHEVERQQVVGVFRLFEFPDDPVFRFALQELLEREQRLHVLLCFEFPLFVHVAIHVDGEARDRHEREARVDEMRLGTERIDALFDDFAREAERPVEPRAVDHAAIRLDIHEAIARALGLYRRRLQAEAREIRMRRRHVERPLRTDCEGEERPIIDVHEILPARFQIPRRAEPQLRKSCRVKLPHRIPDRMIGGHRRINKMQERLHVIRDFYFLLIFHKYLIPLPARPS